MTIADPSKLPTPLYAVVGAGDLVVRRIRTTAAGAEADPRPVPDQLQTADQSQLDALLSELRALPDRAQSVALETLGQAAAVYSELVERGESLVTRVRTQKATADTVAQARTTVAQAKGTATTARKQAAAGSKASRATASRSAKKATKATGTRAKATRTSATKTAQRGAKAVRDAGGKVGT